MPDHEGGHVALFIDWDNLAISTNADHGGSPDLRRIVQTAQGYGTLLIARAYAEWGVTSERLSVYRAGVEPVYAPTFRFADDGPGRPAGGKSLADPCLVSDCIDMLHLHPQLTTLVLVSGDKDLIPIVRLAQMRGKKVIVIGPDLVAVVLREMADEFIAYRTLVGLPDARSAAVRAEAADLGRRRRRRGGRGGRAGDLGPDGPEAEAEVETPIQPTEPITPHPPRPLHRERRGFADRAGVFRPEPPVVPEPAAEEDVPIPPTLVEPPAPRATPPAPRFEAPVPRLEPEAPPEPPPFRREPSPSRGPRPAELAITPASEGDLAALYDGIRTILRERTTAGRPRLRATNLKDHLIARIPGFNERKSGFASFRDLLGAAQAAGVLQITDVGQVQWISLPGADPEAGSAPPVAALAAPAAARLDPLPAPSAATAPPEPLPAPAPPAAPAAVADSNDTPALALDEALQAIVDMRHHTRLLTPTFVTSTLSNLINARAPGRGEEAQRIVEELETQGALRVDREAQEVEVNGAKHRVRLVRLIESSPAVEQAERAWQERNAAAAEALPETPVAVDAPAGESIAAGGGRNSRRGRRGRGGSRTAAAAEDTAGEDQAGDAAPSPAAEGPSDALSRVFDALVEAVGESIAPGKDTAGAAGVKSRLTRVLPDFSEKELGFSKFKDFLLAAERAGRVRVESAGAATRVGLPGGASA